MSIESEAGSQPIANEPQGLSEGVFRAYALDHEYVAGLVEEIRAGNAEAWNPLMTTFYGMMRATAVNSGIRGHDIEDVVQEASMTLFRHIERIAEPERLGGWLKTTTVRHSLRVKKPRIISMVPVANPGDPTLYSDGNATMDADGDFGERNVIKQDQQKVVAELMRGLNSKDQDFLEEIFAAEQPDYKHIVELFGIAIGTIGPKRKRIIDRLRGPAEEAVPIPEDLFV